MRDEILLPPVSRAEVHSCKYCGEAFYGEGWWVCKKCKGYICPDCAAKKGITYKQSEIAGAADLGPFCADCFKPESKSRKIPAVMFLVCLFGVLIFWYEPPSTFSDSVNDILLVAFLIGFLGSIYNVISG